MERHPHTDLSSLGRGVRGEGIATFGRREDRLPSIGEGEEERVSLRADLVSPMTGERLPQEDPMPILQIRVRLRADVVEQVGQSFDVREQEGDGAGWEVAHRGSSSPIRRVQAKRHR